MKKLILITLLSLMATCFGVEVSVNSGGSTASSGQDGSAPATSTTQSGAGLWTCSGSGCIFTQESEIISHIQDFKINTVPKCINMLNQNLSDKGCTELEVLATNFKTECLDKLAAVNAYNTGAETEAKANEMYALSNTLKPFSQALANLKSAFESISNFSWAGSDATTMKSCAQKNCAHSMGSIAGSYSLACLFRECETGDRDARGAKLVGYINALSKVAAAQKDVMNILSQNVSGFAAPTLASFSLPRFIIASTFQYPTNYDTQTIQNASREYNRHVQSQIQSIGAGSGSSILSPLTQTLISSLPPIHAAMMSAYKNFETENVSKSCMPETIVSIGTSLVVGYITFVATAALLSNPVTMLIMMIPAAGKLIQEYASIVTGMMIQQGLDIGSEFGDIGKVGPAQGLGKFVEATFRIYVMATPFAMYEIAANVLAYSFGGKEADVAMNQGFSDLWNGNMAGVNQQLDNFMNAIRKNIGIKAGQSSNKVMKELATWAGKSFGNLMFGKTNMDVAEQACNTASSSSNSQVCSQAIGAMLEYIVFSLPEMVAKLFGVKASAFQAAFTSGAIACFQGNVGDCVKACKWEIDSCNHKESCYIAKTGCQNLYEFCSFGNNNYCSSIWNQCNTSLQGNNPWCKMLVKACYRYPKSGKTVVKVNDGQGGKITYKVAASACTNIVNVCNEGV